MFNQGIATVECPWCDHEFEIDLDERGNSMDDIECPGCKKKSELWADGDLICGYYLTRIKE